MSNQESVDYHHPTEHKRKVTARYSTEGVQVTMPMPNPKHINRFLKRNCALDLLNPKFHMKWDAKEISESEAMLYAIWTHLEVRPTDENVVAYCVGDGARPRTGALLAFTTQWKVQSIDPLLSQWNNEYMPVQRLTIIPSRVQDVLQVNNYITRQTRIIVAPHSHAPLKDCLHLFKNNAGPNHIVAMPCCQDLHLHQEPDKVYYDWACLSPERLVKVWKDIKV